MDLLVYLLKVSACTVLFFAFYLLVLNKLTFFKTNRFYLLLTLLISFIIPALSFTIEKEVVQLPITYAPTEVLSNAASSEQLPATKIVSTPLVKESFNYFSLLPYLYFSVVCGLLVIATWRILQLFKHVKSSSRRVNGLKLVHKSAGFTNCSFFNYVFIDEKLEDAELQILLKHEEVHAKQLHSIDKIIMMLVKALLWFNPVVYLYDNALEQAHEYEADETTSNNFGTAQYASLLLRLAIAKSEIPPVHHFVKSPIKERIKMLFKLKSNHMKKLMYLLALPIGLGLLWGFTVKVVEIPTKSNFVYQQDKPFIQRNVKTNKENYRAEQVTLNTVSGSPISTTIINSPSNTVTPIIWVYVNDKLYAEKEAIAFDKKFISALPAKRGFAMAKDYDIPSITNKDNAYVFWFGTEPRISSELATRRSYIKKYNGKTIEGQILELTYTESTKIMNGFLVKTANGEIVKANVEAKFATQTSNMINKGDKVSLKVYNANYWPSSAYPVLISYKLMKDGKLLFDKWPRVAVNKPSTDSEQSSAVAISANKESPYIVNKSPEVERPTFSAAYKLLTQLKAANDQITTNIMMGQAVIMSEKDDIEIKIDGYTINAIAFNVYRNSNLINAHMATLTDKSGNKISGDVIEFDLTSKSYKVTKAKGTIYSKDK